MYSDRKRGTFYANRRRSTAASLGDAKARKADLSLSVSTASASYLQAFGSPFTDPMELSVDPRIPDPEFTGPTVVCHTDSDFIYPVPNGNACVLTATKPYYFGGVDVLTSTDILPPPTMIIPSHARFTTENPAQASVYYGSKADAADIIGRWIRKGLLSMQARQRSSYENYSEWQTAAWKTRMIGSAIKAHDIGAVQTQQGLIQAMHVRPEFVERTSVEILGLDSPLATWYPKQMTDARLWACFGPVSLFVKGDVPTGAGLDRSAGGHIPASASTSEYQQSFNDVLQNNYRDYYAALFSEADHTVYNTALSDLHDHIVSHSVNNRDEGLEFLTSDGVSLRGYHKGSERPFSDTQVGTWAVGADSKSVDSWAGASSAERGLRREGLSMASIKEWLTGVANLFTPCTDYANIVADMTYNTYTALTGVPGAGDYVILRVRFKTDAAGTPYGSTASNELKTGGVCAFFLCDLHGVPIAMRCEEDMARQECPTGDAPFMYFSIAGVENQRPFKIYRASYEEMQTVGDFIVPSKFSTADHAWSTIASIGADFPSITRGFTFFKKLGDGLKKAISAVWRNRETISEIGKLATKILPAVL